MKEEARTCAFCGGVLRGRSDKKFCDDSCRNNYNNQLKSADNNYVRNVTNILRKNRRILQELLSGPDEMVKASKDKLMEEGFRFRYLTHTYTNKKGSTYFYCYEFGYLPLDGEKYLIVRKKEEM